MFDPHWYQEVCIEAGVKVASLALFLKPGLGKTLITYVVFGALKKAARRTGIRKLVVVAKLRIIYSTWPRENDKWEFGHRISILHGPDKDAAFNEDADVYLINYEGLEWLYEKLRKNKRWAEDAMLVLDESSKIKNTRTKRFKLLKKMHGWFPRRLILTGSPRPRNLEDIFGQVYFLDFGERLGRYITHFRNQWFYPSGYMGYDYKPVPGAEEEIYERISDISVSFDSDVLGMEEPRFVQRQVTLPPKARKFYDELEKEFIAEWEGGLVTVANAAVASGKLRQVANGGMFDGDGKVLELHEEKVEELLEIVEELQGSPLLTAYEFTHDRERILRSLPKDIRKNTEWIGGGVSAKRGQEIEDEWNKGNLAMLLGQPQSVAHGLNLQESGHTVCFFSNIWNLEDWEQFWQRVWRQGQENEVTVISLVAENTVDEVVQEGIAYKDAGQKGLFKALEDRYGKAKAKAGKGKARRGGRA